MRQLAYVESNSTGRTFSIFPYYCTTDTSIVIKKLYIPLQPYTGGGHNGFYCGKGRFQSTGDCLTLDIPDVNSTTFYYGFEKWAPQTPYYSVSYSNPNGLEGDVVEFGNSYIKIDGVSVATGTTYTGNKITCINKPFYLFTHYNWLGNAVKGGRCGQVKFYENGVLAATYTPYEDDNGVAGFLDEQNNTMIYSQEAPWVAGPDASSIKATPSKTSLAATGETINIVVSTQNAWTLSTSGNSFLTFSLTGDTGGTTITATAPSYTGDTAREEWITFTDTVTNDTAEIKIKQKKYSNGQPMYLGDDEITEVYIGDVAVSEMYLGDVLVFSSGPAPTPEP